jgi:regulator of protease activity HflC (stomatin/prohibitin superfamily)
VTFVFHSSVVIAAFGLSGCMTIINQGEVGVRDTMGKMATRPSEPGFKFFLWPFLDITRVQIRTVNLKVRSDLPSREGLTIESEVSILYRVDPESAPKVLARIGPDYENELILPVFRSAVADVTAEFDAKDMHTGKRAEIEAAVQRKMAELLQGRGFVIEAVLLKSVRLPPGLSVAIEDRLRAEQDAQRMVFILERERREAERKQIEAAGIRDSQKTISEGLNPQILRYKAIEALRDLAKSPNAKLVITSDRAPLMLGDDGEPRVVPVPDPSSRK